MEADRVCDGSGTDTGRVRGVVCVMAVVQTQAVCVRGGSVVQTQTVCEGCV